MHQNVTNVTFGGLACHLGMETVKKFPETEEFPPDVG